jgi:hypothetical protein
MHEFNLCNIVGLWILCFEFGLAPLDAGLSSIDDESRRRIHDAEEKNGQLDGNVCLFQHEVADLRTLLQGQKQEMGALCRAEEQEVSELHKLHGQLVARFAQLRSNDVIKPILQKLGISRKQNHAPCRRKQFLPNNRGET